MLLRKENCAFTKAASVKMLAQGFLDLFFDAARHLKLFFFCFQIFDLGTKAAFAKAAFDTLRQVVSISGDRIIAKTGSLETSVLQSCGEFIGYEAPTLNDV